MKSGDSGDAVEVLVGKRQIENVGELEVNVGKLRRALAGEANHLRRQIKREDMLCAFGETACEGAGAATDFQCFTVVCWEMTE